MAKDNFELKVDIIRNIPFALDAVLELAVGLFMISKPRPDTMLLVMGWGFIMIGIIQLVRKIKTFHLTDTELIIKRPLLPFAVFENRFTISKIKEIKFIMVKGRFGGPHLNVISTDNAESFRIETTKDRIDEFEIKLKSLGVRSIRDGI